MEKQKGYKSSGSAEYTLTDADKELLAKLPPPERKKWWAAKLIQSRRSRGVCVQCGKNPPKSGYLRCEPCLAKLSHNKNMELMLKSIGAASIPRSTEKHTGERKLRKYRIEHGLCADCGAPAATKSDGTKSRFCLHHLEVRRAKRDVNLSKGLCWCGEPLAKDENGKSKALCKKHLDINASNEKYRRQKAKAARVGWDIE